ncbi:hypothetical protein HK097_000940 [Rhizophlyctis rosea]|uniref:Uncharacterized protein n=1 Tax=Rhizophlyctis rosea TaxID=64517 RepID=A0AAD5WZ71_9FUNG|nr:hypothetical protein HK097_000940 [Rhizophlyctis rosea]
MTFQRMLVRAAVSIMDRNLIQHLGKFSFAVLRDGSISSAGPVKGTQDDFALFGRSQSHLKRLAGFLGEVVKTKTGRAPPIVLAALNDDLGSFLVVGCSGVGRGGDVRKNTFGLAFQYAAEKTGARVKHEGFDTSVLEIQRDDLGSFLVELQGFRMGR